MNQPEFIIGVKRAILALSLLGAFLWGALQDPKGGLALLAGGGIAYGNLLLFEFLIPRLLGGAGSRGSTVGLLFFKSIFLMGILYALFKLSGERGLPFGLGFSLLLPALSLGRLFMPLSESQNPR